MSREPDWEALFARIKARHDELAKGSELRLRRFVNHVESLGVWEADPTPPSDNSYSAAPAAFPKKVWVAFATCVEECGVAEFIVDGSTQECQRCGRLLYRWDMEEYTISERF